MAKPIKPNIEFPQEFAVNGTKKDFLSEMIQGGFDEVDPDVLAGDNLNKLIDDTYKGLHYSMDGVNDLYKGAVLYDETETYTNKSIVFNIDENGETTIYQSLIADNTGNALTDETKWRKVSLGGSGLEVGDIGIAAFGVDETKGLRRLLNGTILTVNANTQGFVNKLKTAVTSYPSLACTEDEWQEISSTSVGGQCGKFVLNYDTDETTVVSVRLPKIIMPVQGLTDMTKLGELVEAGLPNITGLINVGFTEAQQAVFNGQGALKEKENLIGLLGGGSVSDKTAGHKGGIELDASSSNDIYGNSTTVQQEQVQFPYFIQIATGQETEVNVVNEIELNNPYTLFDSKYSEAPLYNASWLKSSTTYYPKSVYTTAYEALVVENNSEVVAGDSVTLPSGKSYIKRGLSVKLSTAEDITDYDFVINTTDETFRLPQTSNKRSLVDKKEPASSDLSWYNLYSDGWLEQGGIISTSRTSNEPLHGTINLAKAYATTNYIAIGTGIIGGDVIDFESRTNTTLNYWIADRLLSVQVNEQFNWYTAGYADIPAQNLYYYIGETVQNANLINAGRLAEQLNDKINFQQAAAAGMPSNYYVELSLGASGTTYTSPANGWVTVGARSNGSNAYINTMGSSAPLISSYEIRGYQAGTYMSLVFPVVKGEVFKINYNNFQSDPETIFRFVYAQGEEE